MSTKKCETCKFWDNPKQCREAEFVTGECRRVKMYWDATEWNLDGDGRRLSADAATDLAFVQDASDYSAYLITLPQFGCVQHEEM